MARQDQDRTLKYQNALPYCLCCSTQANKNSKVTVDSQVEAHWFNYRQGLGLRRRVPKLKPRLSWNIVLSPPNASFFSVVCYWWIVSRNRWIKCREVTVASIMFSGEKKRDTWFTLLHNKLSSPQIHGNKTESVYVPSHKKVYGSNWERLSV